VVLKRWAGPLITALIFGGVILIIVKNLDFQGSSSRAGSPPREPAKDAPQAAAPGSVKPEGFREYPIGDQVEANQMRIAAVWLPPIMMDGAGGAMDSDLIHLEADIHATEGNPNGFAKDEFVPYLKIGYTITPEGSDKPLHKGELMPMVAVDGLHYGASVAMPKAGAYRLVYRIEPEPPSSGGLGRHSDPVSGVAPWWKPFEASFEWEYPGPPKAS
jgi:periplasmic iron binding protein